MENPRFELKFKKTCFKKSYPAKKIAKKAMLELRKVAKRENLDHVYFCQECSGWHITSMSRSLSEHTNAQKRKNKL